VRTVSVPPKSGAPAGFHDTGAPPSVCRKQAEALGELVGDHTLRMSDVQHPAHPTAAGLRERRIDRSEISPGGADRRSRSRRGSGVAAR
jgi:hypothetical protein